MSAMVFRTSHGHLNMRGAFLHMAGDAAVSLAVVTGAFVMSRTGFLWIDPVLGLAIGAVIIFGAWGLLRESFDLVLDAAPKGIDVGAVRDWLGAQPGVHEV